MGVMRGRAVITSPHNRIINKVAREIFKPVGVLQKGQSRIWLDDNGWWIAIIEFQPTRWKKGTSLTIGVNFQWRPEANFAYNILTFSDAEFVEYISDEQFESKIREYIDSAKLKVLDLRHSLSTIESAKQYILASLKERSTLWSDFDCGTICALTGDKKNAILHYNNILENPHDVVWAQDLKMVTRKVIALIETNEDYFLYFNDVIDESRALKRLGIRNDKFVKIA